MFQETKTQTVRGQYIWSIVIFLVLILLSTFFYQYENSNIYHFYLQWTANIKNFGIAEGFIYNKWDYPPLYAPFFQASNTLASLLGITNLEGLKILPYILTTITALIFGYLYKNYWFSSLVFLVLLINGIVLKFVDVYYAPFLILSFYCIKNKRYVWFSIFYTISFLIKWQPIIMAPYVFMYLLGTPTNSKEDAQLTFPDFLKTIILPAFGVLLLSGLIFQFTTMLSAFNMALSHGWQDGLGVNFKWIINFILKRFESAPIHTDLLKLAPQITKVFFILFFGLSLALFFQSKKTFRSLILHSTLGCWTYFLWSTGVHSNHLFMATALALILFFEDKTHRWLCLWLFVFNSLNLVVFNFNVLVDSVSGQWFLLILNFLSIGIFLRYLFPLIQESSFESFKVSIKNLLSSESLKKLVTVGVLLLGVFYGLLTQKAEETQQEEAWLSHLTQGLKYFYNREYERALQEFEEGAAIDSFKNRSYYWRGLAKFQLGSEQAGIEEVDFAVLLGQLDMPVYIGKGAIELRQNDWEGALSTLSRAIDLFENHADHYFLRGIARYKTGDFQGAVEDFTQSLNKRPYNLAFQLRSAAFVQSGLYNQAFEDMKQAKAHEHLSYLIQPEIIMVEPLVQGIVCEKYQRLCELGECGLLQLAHSHNMCQYIPPNKSH